MLQTRRALNARGHTLVLLHAVPPPASLHPMDARSVIPSCPGRPGQSQSSRENRVWAVMVGRCRVEQVAFAWSMGGGWEATLQKSSGECVFQEGRVQRKGVAKQEGA